MILQKLFEKYDYQNIIGESIENRGNLKVSFFLDDEDKIPAELIGVYISKNRDELFFVLDTTEYDPVKLCSKWDEKIAIFMMFGSQDKSDLAKFKYNIIQLVLYKDEIKDRSEEGSVKISRKIFIPYHNDEEENIIIEDKEMVEIPFCLVSSNELSIDNSILSELKNSIHNISDSKLNFMEKKHNKVTRRKGTDGLLNKNFTLEEFKLIEGWLG